MKNHGLLVVLVCVCICMHADGQAVDDSTWVKELPVWGNVSTRITSIASTPEGMLFTGWLGSPADFGGGERQPDGVLLLKTTPEGDYEWDVVFANNTVSKDFIMHPKVVVSSDGLSTLLFGTFAGTLVLGDHRLQVDSPNYSGGFLARISSDGTVIWATQLQSQLLGGSPAGITTAEFTPDGNTVVVGATSGLPAVYNGEELALPADAGGAAAGLILGIDAADGSLKWNHTFAPEAVDGEVSVVGIALIPSPVDPEKQFVAAGGWGQFCSEGTCTPDPFPNGAWAMVFRPEDFAALWIKTFDATPSDFILLESGDYLMTGLGYNVVLGEAGRLSTDNSRDVGVFTAVLTAATGVVASATLTAIADQNLRLDHAAPLPDGGFMVSGRFFGSVRVAGVCYRRKYFSVPADLLIRYSADNAVVWTDAYGSQDQGSSSRTASTPVPGGERVAVGVSYYRSTSIAGETFETGMWGVVHGVVPVCVNTAAFYVCGEEDPPDREVRALTSADGAVVAYADVYEPRDCPRTREPTAPTGTSTGSSTTSSSSSSTTSSSTTSEGVSDSSGGTSVWPTFGVICAISAAVAVVGV